MGRDLPGLVARFPRRHRRGGAGRRRGTARVGAETVGSGVRVAFLDLDVGGGGAQLFGEDLRVGRLVALALGLRPESRDGLARGMEPDLAAGEHLAPGDVAVPGWAGPG